MREIEFRIYDPISKKMEFSGGTPSMLSMFFRKTAVLNTACGMPYEQFTGLIDKNGKEIYEGDILHTPHYDDKFLYHIVEWSDKYCGWYARNKDERYDRDGSLQFYVYAKYYSECEVVVNIHDELFGNSE